MPLNTQQTSLLLESLRAYDFPRVTYDFTAGQETRHLSMLGVEATIHGQLLADDLHAVKLGLSNVLYWGYANTGYRMTRIGRFRDEVTVEQLHAASVAFHHVQGPAIRLIAGLHLPEFGRLSFVSKIRMFLDPANYVVLDRQLLSLRQQQLPTVFHQIHAHPNANSIGVTRHNEIVYEQWSQQCRAIVHEYYSRQGLRAVDIERGIFHLIRTGRASEAANILFNA